MRRYSVFLRGGSTVVRATERVLNLRLATSEARRTVYTITPTTRSFRRLRATPVRRALQFGMNDAR